MDIIEGVAFKQPFPHLIINNFYTPEELELLWEEFKFYTKPGKLLDAKGFGGVVDKTNSHALALDAIYKDFSKHNRPNYRLLSNILTVTKKLYTSKTIERFSEIDDCCCIAKKADYDLTKIRYYHNGEYYEPHTDAPFQFLAFSYFHKEPKRFSGGELLFPKFNYQFPCDNNSIIIFPGWVEHAVREVKIDNSDYYDGWGRYAITHFFGKDRR